MSGLLSPKPVSYLQQPTPSYNPYVRGLGPYSETPPLSNAPLAHPVPHQPVGQQFMNNNIRADAVREDGKIYSLVIELLDPAMREGALLELSKKREQYDDLALVLWHSFGIMPALLQEIVSVYPLLSPPNLTAHVSNRVCNALALLQCVASHSETRQLFLNAHIPLFLYPFLNTTSKTRPFEYLRLTSLGVIGALVKVWHLASVIRISLTFSTHSKMITTLLSTSFSPPKSFLFAFASWKPVRSSQKPWPSSSSKKFFLTKRV
ncbi:hypothetical protein HGRIS_004669 [Hohenbuehelia grisea]|uniref:Cell differentiation protein rcd1 n=1 Tax=Hohenbuehelia grisea TaxID=104357 RepID=A0ABR3JCK4_9AGAR